MSDATDTNLLKLHLYDQTQQILRIGLTNEGVMDITRTLAALMKASTGRNVGFQLVFLEQHDTVSQINPLLDRIFELGQEYHKLTTKTEDQREYNKLVAEMTGVREKISRLLMQ